MATEITEPGEDDVPDEGDAGTCGYCQKLVTYVTSPYGNWWSHREHPDDDHDAGGITWHGPDGPVLLEEEEG
jgi:hypothetical protein